MTILFISDLHLEEAQPAMAALFFRFLDQLKNNTEALYILGDFFEAWIGDDDLTPFHQSVIAALRATTNRGIPIYLMHGNRDFLIGKRFLKATGCTLLPDEIVVDVYGTPILLMHGDTLCTKDTAYLAFRKRSRIWIFQQLFLLKSLTKRRAAAQKMRQASQEHTGKVDASIMDVTQSEVEAKLQAHRVQHLIHGHTHRPFEHHFNLGQLPATRTVLGPWHNAGSVLICKPDGTRTLEVITS